MERNQDRDWRPGEPTAAEQAPCSPTPEIEIDGRGRAVIAGTAVEAHRIAALLDGDMGVDEVVSDYVTLTREQVFAAKAYADACPWTGQPYPPLTAKKAMREVQSDLLVKFMRRRSR